MALLYKNWMPCAACAKSIIQVGIKRVVYHVEYFGNLPENIKDSKHNFEIAMIIMNEAKVSLEGVSCKIIQPKGLYKFQQINV